MTDRSLRDSHNSRAEPHTPGSRKAVRFVFALAILSVAVVVAIVRGHHGPAVTALTTAHQAAVTSDARLSAPNGTYTTLGGTPATISSLRGKPTVLWFVAGGCASCAASIPAVASHYAELHADGVRIVTLGLWGAFLSGRSGLVQLADSARSEGVGLRSPGWIWGIASQALSLSYDPSGTPDEYFLIDASGHIVYRNSVPVSTMGQMLVAAKDSRQQ